MPEWLTPRLGSVLVLLLCALIAAFPLAPSVEAQAIPVDEVPAIVLQHIETQTAKHGRFWVHDQHSGESIGLASHKMLDGLYGYIEDDTFFASAEFVEPGSDQPVEVDVVMRGTDPEELELLEVSVRERKGETRYHWAKGGDRWERRDGPPPEAAGR